MEVRGYGRGWKGNLVSVAEGRQWAQRAVAVFFEAILRLGLLGQKGEHDGRRPRSLRCFGTSSEPIDAPPLSLEYISHARDSAKLVL